ncbi:hypothetical protein CGMCC3_g5648 [Colletotrichum fructicola]|nr:uncharacterized protein CGMCC3_g5648 [Colletotrichum fructicola]KAE9578482.1 hypothetical protein CGMCC3_g5648 [Colletotrichum fructicola]
MQPPPKKPCITTKPPPPPPPPPILRREIPTGTAGPHTQAAEQAASTTPLSIWCSVPPTASAAPHKIFTRAGLLGLPYPPTPTTQIRDFFAQRRLVVRRPAYLRCVPQPKPFFLTKISGAAFAFLYSTKSAEHVLSQTQFVSEPIESPAAG